MLTSDCLCILTVIRDALSSSRCWINVQYYYFWRCWSKHHSKLKALDVSPLLGRVAGQINLCCVVLWWPADSKAKMQRTSFWKQETLGIFQKRTGFRRKEYGRIHHTVSWAGKSSGLVWGSTELPLRRVWGRIFPRREHKHLPCTGEKYIKLNPSNIRF